jgi:DNA-binding NarL/FixJ family response regulator
MGFVVSKPSGQQTEKRYRGPLIFLIDIATYTDGLRELEGLIAKCSAEGPVLLLAREDQIDLLIHGLRAGAVGFVKQTSSPPQLRKAVLAVAAGNTWCDRGLFRNVVKYLPAVPHPELPTLTKREMKVLQLVSSGESNKEIAAQLGVTEQSIKVYVSNLLKKTGTANRSNLTLYAVTRGLIGAKP